LKYKDSGLAINTANADDIKVEILKQTAGDNQAEGEVIAVKYLSQDSATGYESIILLDPTTDGYIDVPMSKEDFIDSAGVLVDKGMYEYVATVYETDSNFQSGNAEFQGFGEAFILA
jgi:hypothetical protein